jgi:hypothetical protein
VSLSRKTETASARGSVRGNASMRTGTRGVSGRLPPFTIRSNENLAARPSTRSRSHKPSSWPWCRWKNGPSCCGRRRSGWALRIKIGSTRPSVGRQFRITRPRHEAGRAQCRLRVAYQVNQTCRELIDLQRARIRELEARLADSSTRVLPRPVPPDLERLAQRRCQKPDCANALHGDRYKYCSNRCAVGHRWDVARQKSAEAAV